MLNPVIQQCPPQHCFSDIFTRTNQVLLEQCIIITFFINMQVQGQHPHPLPGSWLAARMADLIQDLQVCLSWELPLCNSSPSSAFMSSWASQAHAFHQPVCQRLSWLHHWSIPHVHTSRAISPPEWGTDPQCKPAQVIHWIWWWQCLVAWHCRSVWSLPCQFAADIGGLALSMAKSYWHGGLYSTHNTCTRGHMSWKRGGRKREPVTTPWTSSRWLSHLLWLKVHSHQLLRACCLGSKRKLPPPACQVRRTSLCGLLSKGRAVPWYRVHL